MSERMLGRQATYNAHERKVMALRKAVSKYDAATALMKRKAEREGGPAARLAVDSARSKPFANLREKLRLAEADLAEMKPMTRKPPISPHLGR